MKKRLMIIGAAAMVAASATLPLAAAAETASATADTPIAVDTREGEQRAVSPKDIEYSPDWGGVSAEGAYVVLEKVENAL